MDCECGCGKKPKEGNRFINGHHFRGKKHSKEARLIISEAGKGRKLSNKHKKAISEAGKGRKLSNKHKKAISEAQKGNTHKLGKKTSKETRKKQSEIREGFVPSKETCKKISKAKEGTKHSEETKQKISDAKKGENHHNWQGGLSKQEYGLSFNKTLKEAIRKRDNHTCQECGITENELRRRLDIHHVDYNKKNNKKKNLISLCQSCHAKTNYDRDVWKSYFKKKMKG